MYLIHKILFAITVWFVSTSIILVSFSFYLTNSNLLSSNLPLSERKEILNELNEDPLEERVNFNYSLPYLYLLSSTDSVGVNEFDELVDENFDNVAMWLQGDSDSISLDLAENADEVIYDNIDEIADDYIADNLENISICTANATSNVQKNGYSAQEFCIPAQVRNDQIDFTTFVDASPNNVVDDLVDVDFDGKPKVDPENVFFLSNWVNIRNFLVSVRNATPFLVLFTLLLLAILYYTQRVNKGDLYLEFIHLLGYISISSVCISLLGIILLSRRMIVDFVINNNLPGLSEKVSTILGESIRLSVIDSFIPGLVAGIVLAVCGVVNYYLYVRNQNTVLEENEIDRLKSNDVYDQSVLIASRPTRKAQSFSRTQVQKIENIKTKNVEQNYQDLRQEEAERSRDYYRAPSSKTLEKLTERTHPQPKPAPSPSPSKNKKVDSKPKKILPLPPVPLVKKSTTAAELEKPKTTSQPVTAPKPKPQPTTVISTGKSTTIGSNPNLNNTGKPLIETGDSNKGRRLFM